MSGYNPPIGNSVAYTFSDNNYQAPVGHSVKFDFTPAPVLLDPITFGEGSSASGAMLCGIWVPVSGNAIAFDLKTNWQSESGNNISLNWDCPYISSDCPEMWHDLPGDQIDFYFDDIRVVTLPSDAIDFTFSCATQGPALDLVLGSFYGGEGSALSTPIQETFALSFSDGAVFVPNIAFINTYLPVTFDTGAEVTFNLNTVPNIFPQPAWDGASFAADITQSAIALISAQALEGSEVVSFNLSTQINPNLEFDEGSEFTLDLTTRASINFPGTEADDGAALGFYLQSAITIPATAWEGAEGFCDLTTLINQGMPAEADDGAELTFLLYNVPGFFLEADDGAETVAGLSASYALEASASAGAELIADITPNPNVPFSLDFYAGSEGIADLATTTTFSFEADDGGELTSVITFNPAIPWPLTQGWEGAETTAFLNAGAQNFILYGYEGAEFTGDFTPAPSPAITFQFLEGAEASVTISIAQNLGNFNFLDGSEVNIGFVDTDPLIYAYDGAETFCDLATENTFAFDIYDGGIGSLDIELHPSSGMGNFVAFSGSELNFGALATLISASLAVRFNAGYVVRADIDSSTDFDLTTDACCGPRDETGAYIDIGLAEFPSQTYSGYKQIFTVDLSCRPRFAVNFADGSTFTSKDYSAYFSFEFSDGGFGNFQTDQDIKIRLCKGNFIPDGDNIVVELTTTDIEDCEVNFAYAGATLELVLENNVQEAPQMYDGANFYVDITLPNGLYFNFWDGAALTIHNFPAEMSVNMGDGSGVNFTFAPELWQANEGAIATCGGLSTDYNVEFLEVGCLDNEFVPVNANGDPEPNLARITPMELDPYYHEIKARCF